MEKAKSVLSVQDLQLSYGQKTVLDQVCMEVHAGDFWFLLGPNGKGKTTFLRAILGELPYRKGHIRFDPEFGLRESVGFIPQDCDLNPALPTTVREFVCLGLTGMRLGRKERAERLGWALEQVGLQDMPLKDYWTLSGGQRRRVLVARALIRRPRLLILDEPDRGLDLATAEGFMQLLLLLNRRERLTLIFVTHDLTLAALHATHAALFGRERVLAGPVHEILNAENLERAFGIPIAVRRNPSGSLDIEIRKEGK